MLELSVIISDQLLLQVTWWEGEEEANSSHLARAE
jgi:hypothetical protein